MTPAEAYQLLADFLAAMPEITVDWYHPDAPDPANGGMAQYDNDHDYILQSWDGYVQDVLGPQSAEDS